jgi:ribonuclease E
MAGLVVIDFIDMEYNSNVRKVEKAMKDALKNDRARIQVGRISSFGLMEMSRQRLRTGVLEATTRSCPHCDGTGLVRTASSAGLSALRLIEDEAAKGKGSVISLYASTEAAVYLLNAKRADLAEIEERFGVRVEVLPEGENEGAKMRVVSSGPRPEFVPRFEPIAIEEDDEQEIEDDYDDEGEDASERGGEDAEGRSKRRRKRRRRSGRGRDDERAPFDGEATAEADEGSEADDDTEERSEDGDAPRKKRRRGRRRRGGRGRGDGEAVSEGTENADQGEETEISVEEPVIEEAPVKPKRARRKKSESEPVAGEAVSEPEPSAEVPVEEAPAKPKRTRKKKVETEAPVEALAAEPKPAPVAQEAPAKPKRAPRKKKVEATGAAPETAEEPADEAPREGSQRRGWWQRTFGE